MSRVCRWVGGFAGEWKGLPVSWRVCRWVEGFAGEFKEPSEPGGHRKGCHRRCAAQRVCQRVEGFANALKGLPPWRSFSPPEKTGFPWPPRIWFAMTPPWPSFSLFSYRINIFIWFRYFWRASTSASQQIYYFPIVQDQPPRIRFSLPSLPNLVFHNLPNLESGFPWPPGMLFSMPSPNLVFNDLPESCFSCPPRIWFSVAPNLVCHALWRGRGPQIISHEMLAGVTSFVTRFHLPLPPLSYYFCFHYMMHTCFLYV